MNVASTWEKFSSFTTLWRTLKLYQLHYFLWSVVLRGQLWLENSRTDLHLEVLDFLSVQSVICVIGDFGYVKNHELWRCSTGELCHQICILREHHIIIVSGCIPQQFSPAQSAGAKRLIRGPIDSNTDKEWAPKSGRSSNLEFCWHRRPK